MAPSSPHMHSSTEQFILQEVQPRSRAAVVRSVPVVGTDDVSELVQDGTVMALRLLSSTTRSGRKVTGGNVTFDVIKMLRSGRRSTGERRKGQDLTTLVVKVKRSRSSLQAYKERLAQLVREHLGEDILLQVQESPRWMDNVAANREKAACRYERQTA